MQHNCSQRKCGTSDTQEVYQEREKTGQMQPVVSHIAPQDILLNTAQMRDAIHVQKFRQHSATLNPNDIITASAAREVRAQKELRKPSESTPAPKARAATSQRVRQPQRVMALQTLDVSTSLSR